jgi:hypothetical protein
VRSKTQVGRNGCAAGSVCKTIAKVTKDEIMAAVRFAGRSLDPTVDGTDVDIDIILERGKAKTKGNEDKISKVR